MTNEELKAKAEKAAAKLALIQQNILDEELRGMSDDECTTWMLYYLAATGKMKALVDETSNELTFDDIFSMMNNAYSMVYESDQ